MDAGIYNLLNRNGCGHIQSPEQKWLRTLQYHMNKNIYLNRNGCGHIQSPEQKWLWTLQSHMNKNIYLNRNGSGHIQSLLTTTTGYCAVDVHYTCAMHCSTQCTVDERQYLSNNHQCRSKPRLSPCWAIEAACGYTIRKQAQLWHTTHPATSNLSIQSPTSHLT